jgi:phosphoketolase
VYLVLNWDGVLSTTSKFYFDQRSAQAAVEEAGPGYTVWQVVRGSSDKKPIAATSAGKPIEMPAVTLHIDAAEMLRYLVPEQAVRYVLALMGEKAREDA